MATRSTIASKSSSPSRFDVIPSAAEREVAAVGMLGGDNHRIAAVAGIRASTRLHRVPDPVPGARPSVACKVRMRFQAKIEWPSFAFIGYGLLRPEVSTSTERRRRTSSALQRPAPADTFCSRQTALSSSCRDEDQLSRRNGGNRREMSVLEIQPLAVFTDASTGIQ